MAAMATTNEALSSLQSRTDGLSHTLLCEMEYYCHAREPHELVALECMKTQLAGRQIHLHAGGSPAVVRMTSYLTHKEPGQASGFILLLLLLFSLHDEYGTTIGMVESAILRVFWLQTETSGPSEWSGSWQRQSRLYLPPPNGWRDG